jgi:hypothetical protein
MATQTATDHDARAVQAGWQAPGFAELKQRIAREGWPALPPEDKEKRRWLGILEGHVEEGRLTPGRATAYAELVHRGESIAGLPLDDTPASREEAKRWQADRHADHCLMAAFAALGLSKRMAPGDEETRKAVESVRDDPETHRLIRQMQNEPRRAAKVPVGDLPSSPARTRVPRSRESRTPPSRRQRSSATTRGDPSGSSSDDDPPLERACGECGEPLPPGSDSQRRYHKRCGNAKRQREFKARQRAGKGRRLAAEVRDRAWAAVRNGADPLTVLELITRPPIPRPDELSIVEELRLARVERRGAA